MSVTKAGSASDRLRALGLDLPGVADNTYYVNHRAVDSSVYVSGHCPTRTVSCWARALWAGTSSWRPRGSSRVMPR